MKKDFIRDIATDAFRFYAATGMTYDQAVEAVRDSAFKRCEYLSPELKVIQVEAAIESNSPALMDILAVEKTLDILERANKAYIVKAVKAVYFTNPLSPFRRKEISDRTRYYSLTVPTDVRTVYRWLKEARLLYASLRGLRTTDAFPYNCKLENKVVSSKV